MSLNINRDKLVNYINGELTAPLNNQYLDVINPATGKVYTHVPNSSQQDLDAAISAAKQACLDWQQLDSLERANWLRRLSKAIIKHSDELALAECQNTGKPISLAKNLDIPRASNNFDFYADAITQFKAECFPMNNRAVNYTVREPLGIVACISPWNLPLYLLTWKIAPALVTGNCVIAKPSEITPVTASLLAEICAEINFPKGVLSILHGNGNQIGNLICNHSDIAAISFTGGSETGRVIAQTAGKNLKKVSLELGGKNPAIVLDDCEINKTVEIIVKSAFSNQGQICLCNSRIYIQEGIYSIFKQKLIDAVSSLKLGDPEDSTTQFGAITNKNQFEKILNYINLANQESCEILYGGDAVNLDGRCANGFFIKPTIIETVKASSGLNKEEIFGPVITLNRFGTIDEVINLANDTDYGLAASIFTSNINQANLLANKIKSGIVWVNTWMLRDLRTPFGGMKNSGIGREGGEYSLKFFTEEKNICIAY